MTLPEFIPTSLINVAFVLGEHGRIWTFKKVEDEYIGHLQKFDLNVERPVIIVAFVLFLLPEGYYF